MDLAVVQSKIRTVIITGINKLIERSVDSLKKYKQINDSMIHTTDRNYTCRSPFYAGHLKSHADIAIYISTELSTSTQTETKILHRLDNTSSTMGSKKLLLIIDHTL